VPPGYDWSKQFYQYANRLAHAYWLERLNGIPTRLVFLYFIGDTDVGGPMSREEWESAAHTVHQALGLVTMPPFVVNAFVDARTVAPGMSRSGGRLSQGLQEATDSP
jgi:hypothetical protein